MAEKPYQPSKKILEKYADVLVNFALNSGKGIKKGEVVFRYIPKTTCTEADERKIRKGLLEKLGDDVNLILSKVDDIPLSARGKSQFMVQKLDLRSF